MQDAIGRAMCRLIDGQVHSDSERWWHLARAATAKSDGQRNVAARWLRRYREAGAASDILVADQGWTQ